MKRKKIRFLTYILDVQYIWEYAAPPVRPWAALAASRGPRPTASVSFDALSGPGRLGCRHDPRDAGRGLPCGLPAAGAAEEKKGHFFQKIFFVIFGLSDSFGLVIKQFNHFFTFP